MAQDIADDQLAVGLGRFGNNTFGVSHRGCQRLFNEDMRPCIHCGAGKVGVAVGIGGDHDQIGVASAKAA